MNGRLARIGRDIVTVSSRAWFRIFFLATLGFCVHLPVLQGQFLWDDVYLARDNPLIKSPLLGLEVFRHYLFLGSASAHYRPVQNLSYMVDYYFWNTDAGGFHLTNILLHVASGLLLYRLLRRLFGKEGGLWSYQSSSSPELGAVLIAAIWTVHPVHSAAVDYISGRADTLAFMFASGAWLLFLRGTQANIGWSRFTLYLLAGLCGLLALCSREIACIWLVLFLIHTLVFARGFARTQKIAVTLCSMVVLGMYAGLRQLPPGSGVKITSIDWPAPLRAVLMLRALGDYARLLFWPANLHMERSVFDPSAFLNHTGWRSAASFEYLSILGLCAAGVLVAGCFRRGDGQRLRILGALWFFAAYLPVSNIVELNATVAEHWLYLPSAGALIFLFGCALEFPKLAGRAAGPILALILAALAVRSTIRSSDWQDAQVFFSRTLAAGGCSGRVMVNLAQAYAERGEYGKAEEMYHRILQINPHYTIARNNLGCALSREGKLADAQALFAQSSEEAEKYSRDDPHNWLAAWNYAQLRQRAHDFPSAIATLEKARERFPETWELISLEAECLRESKGPDAALPLVRHYAELHWWHYAARLAEAQLYAEANDAERAEEALRAAAALDVHDAEALNLLSRIYLRQNRLEAARAAQRRAVARQPDKPSEYALLATILQRMGHTEEAQAALKKISNLHAFAMTQPAIAAVAN